MISHRKIQSSLGKIKKYIFERQALIMGNNHKNIYDMDKRTKTSYNFNRLLDRGQIKDIPIMTTTGGLNME